MNKKIITLVLIALLILNTFFWINLAVQKTAKLKVDEEKIRELFLAPNQRAFEKIEKKIERESPRYTYMERLSTALGSWKILRGPMIILVITNAVLVAIYFMIIPFYKKG